ncbi:MmcQ/YjbR family DNA-binding protein [Kribbella sp. NPDC051586]|uniref:MmcQ/YjbR family DNA-binding protein n=1 Tax=Kribbella sp. NPDC051586 TaxID=3364118 RepID=UPI0037A8CF84
MADVHEIASAMPHVTKWERDDGSDRPVYQVGGKSFVFFRTPRPDATDPVTGEKYDDVIMIWVESEDEKLALVSDESNPFFTTPHFDGHPSVLIRGSELGEISKQELAEIIQDAWLSRASNRRATTWLKEHRLS